MGEDRVDTRQSALWKRLKGWTGRHKFPVAATLGGLAAVTTIIGALVPTPIFGHSPAPDLQVAAFDMGTATQKMEIRGSGYVEPIDADVARVQISFRNTGDAPALLTRAVVTVRAHAPLDTCVEVGEALYVTGTADVPIPYDVPEVPWTYEQPISFRVAPNAVDRMELTFSVPELPVFVEPVAVSVDVAVREDTASDPIPVGTARMLVPVFHVTTSLEGLVEDPFFPPTNPGCSGRNLTALRDVLATPALENEAVAPELLTLLKALEDFENGEYYVAPAEPGGADNGP